ncbi:MAG TPA: L,D-transpeptidase [Terracidiphilus sp.]|nr:L,D-transpeptidase [Terracidiphilus sp.]
MSRMATAAVVAAGMAQAGAQQAQVVTGEEPVPAKREIVVSLADRKLALVEDGQVKKVYTVAVGKPTTPSPEGTFAIARRVMNPTYSHNGKVAPAGPRNPVGTRWMGLSIKGYGIHGTNEPKSIGKAASHGCIRMAKADLEELYPLVRVGDTVELIGERNAQTAQVFGEPPAQTEAAQPALTAQNATETETNAAANQVPAMQ